MDNRRLLNGAWRRAIALAAVFGLLTFAGCAPTAPRQFATGGIALGTTPVVTPPATASPDSNVSAGSLATMPSRVSTPATAQSPSPLPTEAYFVYAFPLQPAEVTDYAQGVAAHGYPAIDLFAPLGTDFVAVTSGVVDFVSPEDLWDAEIDDPATRGGLAVAMLGDDGVRYYGSHLSTVAPGIVPGTIVERGQLLGTVGSTGNAQGKDSHLHFGISHPTYPEDWHTRRGEVDPFPYLEAWEIGIDIRPRLP